MCEVQASSSEPTGDAVGIVMPLYVSHFHHARNFVWTYCALVEDALPVPIGFVMSNEGELSIWRTQLKLTLDTWHNASGSRCRLDSRLVHWEQVQRARDSDSHALLGCRSHSKYDYQTVKKLYGLLFFRFGRALVLDAEARILKRMSMRALFAASYRSPSHWFSMPFVNTKATSLTIAYVKERNALLAMDAARLVGHRNADSPRAAYDALGVPYGANFLDVQHWFYDWPWLSALAAKLESANGNISSGVCEPPGTYEATLTFSFLYRHGKNSSCYPFYNTEEVLVQAGLASLLSRGRMGTGDALFHRYTGGLQMRERMLSVVDHPRRPVFFYREWAGLDNSPAEREAVLTPVRALVCRSEHLFLSVCGAPGVPYHCVDRKVRIGMPGMPPSGQLTGVVPYSFACKGRSRNGVLSKNARWRCMKHQLD